MEALLALRNQAFVSCAGEDNHLVDQLVGSVPPGTVSYYRNDFVDGEALLNEMENHVRSCSKFIFLASKASVASVWCRYEISIARLESILHQRSVLVLPLDKELHLADLPEWMRANWISPAPSRLPIIKRRFIDIIEAEILEPKFVGNSTRVERVYSQYFSRISATKSVPHVFLFSGLEGIGRSTVARGFLNRLWTNRRFSLGPQIALQDPASIEDFYVQLREETYGPLGRNYESELRLFRCLPQSEQIKAAVNLVEVCCADDETVYVRCKSGLFGDDGYFLHWARQLIHVCSEKTKVRLIVISSRQPRFREDAELAGLLSVHLDKLPEEDITTLVRDITYGETGIPLSPTSEAKSCIGGHPILARHYAYAVSTYGDALEGQAIYDTLLKGTSLFANYLDFENLRDDEKKLLAVLSWVPHLDGSLLREICHAVDLPDFSEALEECRLASLVEISGGKYSISGPVRHVFRQFYGDGDSEVALRVALALKNRLDDPDKISSEILDLLAYLLTLFGQDLPQNVRNLISSSSLLRVARVIYSASRDGRKAADYERVIAICEAGKSITTEYAVQRDFDGVRARCLMRLRRFPEANEIIVALERDGGRQSLNLRAQFLRFTGEYARAASTYQNLIESGYTAPAILHECCICLRQIGRYTEISSLINKYADSVNQNSYLLGVKISMQIGTGKWRDAELSIATLARLPDGADAAAEKEAALITRESKDYQRAIIILDAAIVRSAGTPHGSSPELHAARAIILSKVGRIADAKVDAAVVRLRHRNGEHVANRLDLHILLAEGRVADAFTSFQSMKGKTMLDKSILRDIDASLGNDPAVSLSARQSAIRELATMGVGQPSLTEFDF